MAAWWAAFQHHFYISFVQADRWQLYIKGLGTTLLLTIIALGLARGSNLARFLVSAVMVLRIIAAVWVAMTFSGRGGVMASAMIGGMAVIILLLLWNSRADRFFLQG